VSKFASDMINVAFHPTDLKAEDLEELSFEKTDNEQLHTQNITRLFLY